MVENCVTAVRQGQALPSESALEVRARGVGMTGCIFFEKGN